jgi:hypothetical protein
MKAASGALIAYLAAMSSDPVDMVVFCVDLYTITLVDGTVLRYTTGDRTITVGGHTYVAMSSSSPTNPALNRSKVDSKVGLDVTSLELDVYATPATLVEGIPLLTALRTGLFDGASVLVLRLIQQNPTDVSLGTFIQFAGTVGDISEITNISARIEVKALTEYLNVQMPRNLFQPGCRHALFDAGCTLSAGAFRVSGTVTGSPNVITIPTNLTQPGPTSSPVSAPTLSSSSAPNTNILATTYYVEVTYVTALGETTASPESFLSIAARNVLVVHSPPSGSGITGYNVYVGLQSGAEWKQNGAPISIGTNWTMPGNGALQGIPAPELNSSGYFTLGVVTFTSGVLNGLSYAIQDYTAGVLTLVVGALAAPSAGDTFTIIPGCDKQLATCQYKFSNLIHFGGTPFIPQPESVI